MSAREEGLQACPTLPPHLVPFRDEWRKASKRPEWKDLPAEARFHQSYIVAPGPLAESDCWYWVGTTTSGGSGQFAVGDRREPARRFVLRDILGVNPLPPRAYLRCGNKACVNPDHLVYDDTPVEWGDPATAPRIDGRIIPRRAVARFWTKVDKERGYCWWWTGTLGPTGYGQFFISGDWNIAAHRIAYAIEHGTVPKDLHICHGPGCEDRLGAGRLCVNPAHLRADTAEANSHDMNGGHFRRDLAEISMTVGERELTKEFMVNLGINPDTELDPA